MLGFSFAGDNGGERENERLANAPQSLISTPAEEVD
jgi:hypothetical protein